MTNNNGLKTKIFGPPMWKSLHFTSMGYPEKNIPVSKQKKYKRFFTSVGDTLPCGLCRTSYKQFIKDHPFDEKVMSSRKNLAFHLFKIHNLVNKKLGCKQLPKKDFMKMYNHYDSFRSKSGCRKSALGCH